jgi:hypothetical protein
MRVVFCLTLQYVCTAVGVECIQIVIWENTNFFWDIGSPYKRKCDSTVRNTAMLCASILVLCIKCRVSCFCIEIKGLCVQRKSAKLYTIASHYGRK